MKKRINIILEDWIIDWADEQALKHGVSRSAWIATTIAIEKIESESNLPV